MTAFTAHSAEELQDYGRRLAASLPAAARIVLVGDLGAGKTTLVKGLAEGLGLAAAHEVTSPTFTLVHEYHRGGRGLYHVDLYRLDTAAQIATLGLEDMLTAPAAVVAIEWGEKIEATLPLPYLRVQIDIPAPDSRSVTAGWVSADPSPRHRKPGDHPNH